MGWKKRKRKKKSAVACTYVHGLHTYVLGHFGNERSGRYGSAGETRPCLVHLKMHLAEILGISPLVSMMAQALRKP